MTPRFPVAAALFLTLHAQATNSPALAPGKFIPTFAVKYGSSSGWPDLREAARFDVIIAGAGSARPKADPSIPANTWQALKQLNPHLVVVLYQIGPAEYNTAEWGRIGQGWPWILTNHGSGPDRWISLGARYGQPLQAKPYPNERMMLPGNPEWQQYWLDHVHAGFWGDAAKPAAATDGVFADNTRFSMIWKDKWRRQGAPDTPDNPSEYYVGDRFNEPLYHAHMSNFFARAFPWMAAKGRKLVLNFGDMVREPATWAELDEFPAAPFAAMEEGAFVHPWGSRNNSFVFRPEKDWLTQVEVLRKLKHVRALMNVHGPVASDASGLDRMEKRDGTGRRAWDVLWYALTSFLQGYDDTRQNGLLNFTLWSYVEFHWVDEFDPRFLHLGPARDTYRRVDGATGHVYLREFADGWAVVNPSNKPAKEIPVPAGEARVIDHDNLKSPETRPLIRSFDLAAQRGIILLKAGRAIGNSDND